ncbi:hydantoinase B/oxoprolinase family protein [bacterium]|nr:hydantoinase B/oxoprolinase family protein [bacterium]
MVNQVELEIFRQSFLSIVEEMSATLRRTAFSQKIREGGAYSCGLFDKNGRMISCLSPIPFHLAVGTFTLKTIQQQIPHMNAGDVYIINDPFKGGTHLANIILISPVFIRDSKKPSFYVMNSAHHSEVGGVTSGGVLLSKSIIEEGVFIEPIKLIDNGKLNQEFLNAFYSKVSNPKERECDLKAQIASNKAGIENLLQLLNRYKYEELYRGAESLMNYSENWMKKTVESIPDGEYSFVDYLDGDGLGNKKIKLRVQIDIKGDKAIFNFSKSHEVVRGPLNAVYSITYAAVFYVLRSLIEKDIPLNDGCMRPIEIQTKKHTILNASYPSSIAGGVTETAQRVVDVILGALSKAIPDKIPAASQGTMNNITIMGFDSQKNKAFTFYETIPGGVGAAIGYNPPPALQTHMMAVLNESIESIEHRYPIRILRFMTRKGSGGGGVSNGSCGVIKEYQVMSDCIVTIVSERRLKSPYGLDGGKTGKRGVNYYIKYNTNKEIFIDGKVTLELLKGDRVIIETPGGGGWGKNDE